MSELGPWLSGNRKRLRAGFWLYAAALFTATHWPALEIHVPSMDRPDLLIHFAFFGAWFCWFWASGWVGEPLEARSILLAAIASVAYAGFDEGLQAIPFVRRHCAWDDFFANCGGIALATLLAGIIVFVWAARVGDGAGPR